MQRPATPPEVLLEYSWDFNSLLHLIYVVFVADLIA
jgi:hypothetical protein